MSWGTVIGVLDHETQLTRAFVIKASPEVNQLIERITLSRPPDPYQPRP